MMRMNKGAAFHNVVLTATAYMDKTFSCLTLSVMWTP